MNKQLWLFVVVGLVIAGAVFASIKLNQNKDSQNPPTSENFQDSNNNNQNNNQTGSGTLMGHVTIGPNCPGPEIPGKPCPPKPEAYQAVEIVVYKGDPRNAGVSKIVAGSTHLNSLGDFSLSLPAGSYTVTYKYGGGLPGSQSSSQGATIKAGQITTINFSIDTGIR